MTWREYAAWAATIAFGLSFPVLVVGGAVFLDESLRHQRRMECTAAGHAMSECVLMERCK